MVGHLMVKNLRICSTSAVLTEYRRVTDGRTDILRRHSPRYAYASRGKKCISCILLLGWLRHVDWQWRRCSGLRGWRLYLRVLRTSGFCRK